MAKAKKWSEDQPTDMEGQEAVVVPEKTETVEIPVKEEAKPVEVEVKRVTLGVPTINDHERRITILEAKLSGKYR